MEANSDYLETSQRRRVSKPLIEKRRRARINRSLSQLVEMVAKPNKVQENRTARFEKAYILEMTVEYVKKTKDKRIFQEKPSYDEYESSFQEGYRLCMTEVQNFFKRFPEDKVSEEQAMKSLLKYLYRKLKAPSTNRNTLTETTTEQFETSAVALANRNASEKEKMFPRQADNGIFITASYKSENPSFDCCSSSSQPSTEDESAYSISESESSYSDGRVFHGPEKLVQNEECNKNELRNEQIIGKMWRPW